MHWTKHYKPVKDCQFPFQAYVEEDWIADHQKTEISIKKGDIIVVYGECEPDGHNAADVPRTSKRINGIMDVKYPVFDKESTNYWIGSVQNATGASDYYAKHKVGHFPISKVVPLDIHLWEVEVARKKRVEERQRRRNAMLIMPCVCPAVSATCDGSSRCAGRAGCSTSIEPPTPPD